MVKKKAGKHTLKRKVMRGGNWLGDAWTQLNQALQK